MRRMIATFVLLSIAGTAGAVQLDLDNPNGIAAMWSWGEGSGIVVYVVCTDGSGFRGTGGTWQPSTAAPVPLAEIADWTPMVCYTTDGRWYQRGSVGPDSRWELMDGTKATLVPPPCYSPVGTQVAPMWKVKGLYR